MRKCARSDRESCLAMFDALAPGSRSEFESWLEDPAGPYFVMEHSDQIVGCGGYRLSADRTTATLEWGMVRLDSQKMGLGRFLLMYRMREIGGIGTVSIVLAYPPQAAAGFFEKQGFRFSGDGTNAWVKKLTVCQ